jgi:hypothetical protein
MQGSDVTEKVPNQQLGEIWTFNPNESRECGIFVRKLKG